MEWVAEFICLLSMATFYRRIILPTIFVFFCALYLYYFLCICFSLYLMRVRSLLFPPYVCWPLWQLFLANVNQRVNLLDVENPDFIDRNPPSKWQILLSHRDPNLTDTSCLSPDTFARPTWPRLYTWQRCRKTRSNICSITTLEISQTCANI